jgi:hypothetical protein
MRAKNALISGEASCPSSASSRRRIALSRLLAGQAQQPIGGGFSYLRAQTCKRCRWLGRRRT